MIPRLTPSKSIDQLLYNFKIWPFRLFYQVIANQIPKMFLHRPESLPAGGHLELFTQMLV